MSRVRIVQCLCPTRHCVIACAYESPDGSELPEYVAMLRSKFIEHSEAQGFLLPECGLCHSKILVYEDRPTIFATMGEAAPHFQAAELEQAAIREFWDSTRN